MPKPASKAAKRPARKPPAKKGKAKRAAGAKQKAPASKPAGKKTSTARSRKARREDGAARTAQLVGAVLDDMKALDVRVLDVRHLTSVTDTMIVAGGRSDRHVRAIADALIEKCTAAGVRPLGVEGQESGEWVLVDLADVVVHVMLPRVRDFYKLESLWDMNARDAAAEL